MKMLNYQFYNFSALVKAILSADDDDEVHGLTSFEIIFKAGGKNLKTLYCNKAVFNLANLNVTP